jgi:hypothetical protein
MIVKKTKATVYWISVALSERENSDDNNKVKTDKIEMAYSLHK